MTSTENAERRDGLRQEIAAMRKELKDHVEEEMPVIRAMMQELGTSEQVRERRIFIEDLVERSIARRKLRTAIIEKGLLVALVALLVFVGQAVYHEVGDAVRLMLKGPR